MRDHHDGLAELVDGLAQQAEDLGRTLESRLPVGSSANTTAGLWHERAGDRDALLLAAGELRGAVRAAVAEADGLDELLDPLVVGLAARRA